MSYKFQQLTAMAVCLASVTACNSTAEEASAGDATKSEPGLTVTTSIVHTSAPLTATLIHPSATATVVVPTFTSSPVPKPTETIQAKPDPTATNTDAVSSPTTSATPTIPVPTTTPIPSISSFTSSDKYDTFSDKLQQAFQAAVDDEYAASPEKASISVAVYTDNTMWTYAIGSADTNVDITVETPILIGSTSKTFVSALVLTQIENGLYSLNDPVGTVLSEHPDYASFDQTKVNPSVTVAELLSMTSGLADYNENIPGKVDLFSASTWKPADNINLIQSSYQLPGAFEYNDTNLVLLGLIAELYGQDDLYTLYRTTFLEPLEISAVFLSTDTTPTNTARPYDDLSNYGGGFGNLIDAVPYTFDYYITGQGRIRWACCGLISTPENIVRWAYELYSSNGQAVSGTTRSILFDSLSDDPVLFQGSKQHYGYFMAKRTFSLPESNEVHAYGHPGGGGGYSSLLRYSPQLDLSVSVLANSPLKFQGTCGEYAPRSCIAVAIFGAYAD